MKILIDKKQLEFAIWDALQEIDTCLSNDEIKIIQDYVIEELEENEKRHQIHSNTEG